MEKTIIINPLINVIVSLFVAFNFDFFTQTPNVPMIILIFLFILNILTFVMPLKKAKWVYLPLSIGLYILFVIIFVIIIAVIGKSHPVNEMDDGIGVVFAFMATIFYSFITLVLGNLVGLLIKKFIQKKQINNN